MVFGYWLLAIGQKPSAKSQVPKAKSQKPKAKSFSNKFLHEPYFFTKLKIMKLKNKFLLMIFLLTISISGFGQTPCLTHQSLLANRNGFAQDVTGAGNNGTFHEVTNNNDSGPGSLRDAVSQNGRWIVFSPNLNNQTINLQSVLKVKCNTTIDGRCSSVKISGATMKLKNAHNVIVTGLTFNNYSFNADIDLVQVLNSDLTWFHHNEFYSRDNDGDGDIDGDGQLDITFWGSSSSQCGNPYSNGTPAESRHTVDHNQFYNGNKCQLIGNFSGNAHKDKIYATVHHNLADFQNSASFRFPLVKGAKVHLYNNYILNWTGSAVTVVQEEYAGDEPYDILDSHLYSEKNLYSDTSRNAIGIRAQCYDCDINLNPNPTTVRYYEAGNEYNLPNGTEMDDEVCANVSNSNCGLTINDVFHPSNVIPSLSGKQTETYNYVLDSPSAAQSIALNISGDINTASEWNAIHNCGCNGCNRGIVQSMGATTAQNLALFTAKTFENNIKDIQHLYVRNEKELNEIFQSENVKYNQVQTSLNKLKPIVISLLRNTFLDNKSVAITSKQLNQIDNFLFDLSKIVRGEELKESIKIIRGGLCVMENKPLKKALVDLDNSFSNDCDNIQLYTYDNLNNEPIEFSLTQSLKNTPVLHYSIALEGHMLIQLFDSNGRLARTILKNEIVGKGSNKTIIDLVNLNQGVYVLKVVFTSELGETCFSDNVIAIH